ncbi:MAG: nickel pincer cofactor biosynthesis protein LarB [Actinomycetota bacterium]|nr:nickel pincer cofactor biosynthesis protein LarB [Actinomycetota bacterium]
MDVGELEHLIDGVRAGTVSPDDAVAQLRRLPFTAVGDSLVDHHRAIRTGMPEAVYGQGKTTAQCIEIVGELLAHGSGPVLLTRVSAATEEAVLAAHPGGFARAGSVLWRAPDPHRTANVLVVSAGTSDVPVVDECVLTLQAYGFRPDRLTDVGVAGLHRLLAHLDRVTSADAVVVVAGMEGALASVIGGLTACPVVAVPTSVGYGAGLDGVTALLSMHAACASGITVVGIDNGFGAACALARMFR